MIALVTSLAWGLVYAVPAVLAVLAMRLGGPLPRFVGRRVLMTYPLIFGVITLIFVLLELAPGDITDRFITPDTTPEVREVLIAKWHLNDPAYVRYLYMLWNMAQLDFGVSMAHGQPVFQLVRQDLPNTLLLSVVTLIFLFPTGIVLGSIQAIRQGRPTDTGISVSSLFMYSMPVFWLALMLQLIFGYWWPILPLDGMQSTLSFTYTPWQTFWDLLWHLILPGAAMGVSGAAGTARYMRSAMLEVIRQDYIRTARAKGLSESVVLVKHALRNALLPVITLLGLTVPYLFAGSVLIETVFSWPGMGRRIISATFEQDTPVIMACYFISTLLVVSGNLLADIAYAFVDPRIQYD